MSSLSQHPSAIQLRHACPSLDQTHFAIVQAQALNQPYLLMHNQELAAELDLSQDFFTESAGCELFTGSATAAPPQIAYVYSGHQFGVWAGQLGDGRALSIGRLPKAPTGEVELQLKGAGQTPFSRMGDGRAALRSSIREYLCSEAMHSLGIASTRALCLYGSDQLIMRETPEKSAILTRVAPHFFRFGQFEHWFYQGKYQQLKELADHCLEHYFPACQQQADPYLAMLAEICLRTGKLIAEWQAVGFMHGVMNTDNMSLSGLTIDYGPFGFMEAFDPTHICNHSDQQGRYAYHAQPYIADWNCHALAQCFTALHDDEAGIRQALASYQQSFVSHYRALLSRKFGLTLQSGADDELLERFFQIMAENQADYTQSFRALCQVSSLTSTNDDKLLRLFSDQSAISAWLSDYQQRLRAETQDSVQRQQVMLSTNPKYVLRNYLAEIAIQAAQQGDFTELRRLNQVLQQPYAEQPEFEHYATTAPAWAENLCVSCSS